MTKKVLMPLPSYGFDPTESAIPWKLLTQHDIEVVFATPNGQPARADEIMLTGRGLGIFGPLLKARKDAIQAYEEMEKSSEFLHPISYEQIQEGEFDALFLPGGHDKGVKEYLESSILQTKIPHFFTVDKPVAAVCHAPLLLARSIDPKTGQSVLFGRKTTALLRSQERLAYHLTKAWMKDYYLTYPETTVEDEVKEALDSPSTFLQGPIPLARDSEKKWRRGFVVQDGNYLSARWPGDIYHLTQKFIETLLDTPT